MKLTLLLSKDPTSERVGDTAMVNELLDLVRHDHEVSIICWSDRDDVSDGIRRLRKPAVRPATLAARALRTGRSVLHARFDDPALRAAIDEADADAFVAVHLYMAEAFLRSTKREAPLFAVNVVPEAPVWTATRRAPQLGAITRDEDRVIGQAVAVGSYDKADAQDIRDRGARRSIWLPLSLPPRAPVDVAATPPRLAVLGDRTWAPNQLAWERMLELWPQVSAGIDGAELVAIGRPPESVDSSELPTGVTDLGFVDDLDATLATCRAMAAPITVGGGVRVKLLEAAAVGLPVVATSQAVGSLAELLDMTPADDDADFVQSCRLLLTDPLAAEAVGRSLHETNRTQHESGRALAVVREWLS